MENKWKLKVNRDFTYKTACRFIDNMKTVLRMKKRIEIHREYNDNLVDRYHIGTVTIIERRGRKRRRY